MVSTGTAKSFQVSHFYGALEVDDDRLEWGGWVRGQGSVDCIFVGVVFVVLLLHPKTWR